MERNVLPIRYIVRYEGDDEIIHDDQHPYCRDADCPCYADAPTIRALALRLPKGTAEHPGTPDEDTEREIQAVEEEPKEKKPRRPLRRLRLLKREKGDTR